ncbi:hypothetical protein DPU24_26290 [Salmonella enterica subsp. enterica serovar Oranienburg]|nr:hypothetical protein [Salmonella enterica subsp. enterica serovar Oranienburg]
MSVLNTFHSIYDEISNKYENTHQKEANHVVDALIKQRACTYTRLISLIQQHKDNFHLGNIEISKPDILHHLILLETNWTFDEIRRLDLKDALLLLHPAILDCIPETEVDYLKQEAENERFLRRERRFVLSEAATQPALPDMSFPHFWNLVEKLTE